ncbi:type II toxin-antitoxin system RelE/ParE family toxin [Synechocystis salina LEGE 06099]|uniref:type II toxin-antitoxin system RelE family toxin n=1 Tax=Synechocystis salina TaxID=945780 RepID=UPI00187E1BBA|nr:type II toxin-antitoxin system RelE/ParE family toxin [Synechocystis salina LEGE 06099]
MKFKTSAAKEFRKLPLKLQQRLQIAINNLKNNPRSGDTIKLRGSDYLYRLRVGDYRIIYQIDDQNKIVVIFRVGHRRDVYDN